MYELTPNHLTCFLKEQKKKKKHYESIHRYSRSVKEFTAPVFFQIRSTNNPKQRLKYKKTVHGRRRTALMQVWQSPEVWHIVVLSTSVLFEWVHYMSLSQDGIRPRPRSRPSPRSPPLSGTRARHAGKFSKKDLFNILSCPEMDRELFS